uniref:Uncharacterized protein n=1 Tax=Alexandrium catenella TaxID=2925 RepID=A0A7S1S7N9_ALECA
MVCFCFEDCLASENPDLVRVAARVEECKNSFAHMVRYVQRWSAPHPPAARHVANVLIAASLRNNTCLEGLHGGHRRAKRQNSGARFSEPELQKLHAQASVYLAAIQGVAATSMRLERYIKGLGPCPIGGNRLPKEQLLAMRRQCPDLLEPDEMLTLYNSGLVPICDGPTDWDTDTRSGGLWMDLPPLPTPLVVLKGLSRPEFETDPELETDYKPVNEELLMTTWRAWHIMRVVFMHTAFLRGPCRKEQYSSDVAVIDDEDMKVLMIQASSNMEKILQQQASLSTADFDSWLCGDRQVAI